MKILHVNYYDIQGGAAKAAYRLHRGLLDAGHDSIMLVAEKRSSDNSVKTAFAQRQLQNLHIKQRLEVALTYYCRHQHDLHHSMNTFDSGIVNKINLLKPDVVNLHWINGCMLSIKEIVQIKAPIAWTLHDTWAYSGAEHYHHLYDQRFKNGYDKSGLFDINRYIWKQKIKYWNKLNFNIVAPSAWLGKEAEESYIMRDKNIQVIHNGIDLNTFIPVSKEDSKDKNIIAFGAFDVNDWNKGGKELLGALRFLRDKYKRNFELLLIGNGQFENEFETQNTGFVSSDTDIAKIYPKADVFVLASKYDNLPNMLVEASACGIPLVGFNTGGIPDIIEHKENGYLAKAFDCEDFAHGLDFVLDDKNNSELKKNARGLAQNKFDIKNIAKKYIKLYEKIINE